MSISCEAVARHILPLYRSYIAKELTTKYHLTQIEAAKKLGTTQAAISQYINSKRAVKAIPNYEQIEPIVQQAATAVAKHMATVEMSSEEFSASLCELCAVLQENNKI